MCSLFEFPPGPHRHQSDFCWCLWRMILRFCQLGLAFAVTAFYGVDLLNARKAGVPMDVRWIIAVAIAAATSATLVLYALMCCACRTECLWLWDCLLALAWAAVTGIFGAMWFPETMEKGLSGGQKRMCRAAWVDLSSMLAWMLSAALTTMMSNRRWRHSLRKQPLPPIRKIIHMGVVEQKV